MFGWTFVTFERVLVTGIGWYDDGHDGLFHSHQIGLWQDLNAYIGGEGGPSYGTSPTNITMLTSLTIPAGMAAPLDGPWRKIDLDVALTLEPGAYALAGTYEGQNEDIVRYSLAEDPGGRWKLPTDPRIEIR